MKKLCFVVLMMLFSATVVQASSPTCTVSVTPNTLNTNETDILYFTVTNTYGDGAEINYLRFVAPANGFTINSTNGAYVTGATINESGTTDEVTLSGLGAYESQDYALEVSTGVNPNTTTLWSVYASASVDGTDQVGCTGDATVAIASSGQASIGISGVSISLTDKTATITWDTAVPTTGLVNYGTSNGYGQTVQDTSMSLTHSVKLSSLSPNTSYHYQVISTDANGNEERLVDNVLTTANEGVNTVTTTTVTNTVTTTVSNTVSKIITDTTPPLVKVDPIAKKVYESAPLIIGSTNDDRGIAKVEYRIKGREASWSSASLEGEVGVKKTEWEFLPPLSLDGTYNIEVRAVDVFGNVSARKSVDFVIDQLPPTVGGGVVSYGALPLYTENGKVQILPSREYEVVLYESGGADQVTLELENHQFQAQKIGREGLWRGVISLNDPGEYTSKVVAVDGAGNRTEREWIKFAVRNKATVTTKGEEIDPTFKLYWKDPTTRKFETWRGEEYGVDTERYGWVLPQGEYYVEAEWDGAKVVSQRITLATVGVIDGAWDIGEPTWWQKMLNIRRFIPIDISSVGQLVLPPRLEIGREKWIGEKSVIYLGTKSLPWDSVELRKATIIAEREHAKLTKIEIQGADDPKGEWLEKLNIGMLPRLYVVNDRGDIIDYKEGVWER